MKASATLAAWLDDPEARQRTQDRIQATRSEWRRAGPLAGFEETLSDIAAGEPAAIPVRTNAALRSLFATAGWLDDLLADMVARCSADPFFEPPVRTTGTGLRSGLILVDRPIAGVSLRYAGAEMIAASKRAPGPRSISFTGVETLLRIFHGGATRVALYEAGPAAQEFAAAAAAPCRLVERRIVHTGDLLEIDGRTQSFVIEEASSDLLVLMGEVRSVTTPIAREYDSETLALIGLSAAEEVDSRIQLMLSLLRAQGRVDARGCFDALVRSAPFFMRWYAMREWLALDPDAAIPALERMSAADPHPEVRAAAGTTCVRLRTSNPGLFSPTSDRQAA